MYSSFLNMFKIACIFIGTVVGAGLASGKEIYQFFSVYGIKSFLGILLCFFIYLIIGNLICNVCNKKNLSSYNLLINEVCPKFPAKVLNLSTGLYYFFSSSIIFAASGSIINQFFSVHKIYGTIIMLIFTVIILKFSMKGITAINAITVPIMILVIFVMFIMFELFSDPFNVSTIGSIEKEITIHKNLLLSSFLYGGFNILSASGILAPLAVEYKKKDFKNGILLGSFLLVFICLIINYLILVNMPYVAKYDIPILYISKIFGKGLQVIILVLIWLEMLSTQVSSIYSLAKSLSNKYNKSIFKFVIGIILFSLPVSIFGFTKLILIFYPFFGLLSFIFMIYIVKYGYKNRVKKVKNNKK